MDINYIREYITLAECLNFTEAAERLYITQSTLSKHIKSLEEQIGVPLFKRTTRSIELTESGRFLLTYARKINALINEAETGLEILSRKANSSLTIGVLQNPQIYNLAKYLMSFRKSHPDASFNMIESDEAGLLDMFGKKLFNIFTAFEPQDNVRTFNYMPMVRTQIEALLSINHPLAYKESIDIKELAQEPLLLPSHGSTMSKVINNGFNDNGVSPTIIYEGSSLGCIDLVREGLGVSLHATEFADYAVDSAEIVRLQILQPLEFTYGVGYRDPDSLTAAELEYLNHMREYELK